MKCGHCVITDARVSKLIAKDGSDPKCKLNISSFLTHPHLLDSLICTRNSVSIVLPL